MSTIMNKEEGKVPAASAPEPSDGREKEITNVTLFGSFANALLLIFKFVAGFLGNSSAMIADAVHSLSDFLTDIVVLAFVRISSRPEDEGHDYGHGKYETLATSIIGAVLLFVGFGLLWDGCDRIWLHYFRDVPLESPGIVALYAALASIVVKEFLFRITLRVGRKRDSQVVIANAWHHRSDAFSSIGTALGIGGAILLGEDWRILDPLAAVIVSLFIIRVSLRLMLPAVQDLLEVSLPAEIENQILEIITESPKVKNPHHLRTRRIGNKFAIEAHIRVDGHMTVFDAHALTQEIEHKLRQKFGAATHVVLHVEPIK